ncbi:MAG: hypothetical protein HY342_05980 [Candidatus Lambdaproteobacteria bacterium]|nr:hypothetical protein [Candidatus Lambdaproteobacteria bacterium]
MTTKAEPRHDKRTVEQEQADPLELRDESDEIIDTLRRQLASLQHQLDTYRASESGGGAAAPPEPPEVTLATWNAELTPRLTRHLQRPAEELTERLGRIIAKVEDPELREELIQCRETAFFLFDTFRRISDNHQVLTDSLSDTVNEVSTADFARLLEHLRGDHATPLAVSRAPAMPARVALRTASTVSILRKLTLLAETVTESGLRVDLDFTAAADGDTVPPPGAAAGPARLRVRLVTPTAWERLQDANDVASIAFRPGATAEAVVDLLYVQKIVELQGGLLAFHQRGGQVFGFELLLPAAALAPGT